MGALPTLPLQLLAGLLRRPVRCAGSPANDGGSGAKGAVHDQAEPPHRPAPSALRPRPLAARRRRHARGGLLLLRARCGPSSISRLAEMEAWCASQRKGMRIGREKTATGLHLGRGERRQGENAYLGCLFPSTQNRCSLWLFCWKRFFSLYRTQNRFG